jgi:hypothetical protein
MGMTLDGRIEAVTGRSRAFFNARTPGHFLVHAYVPFKEPAFRPLNGFDLECDLEGWLDYQLEIARCRWRAKEGLDDDHLPSLCPVFGMAEYSAWMGMDVHLQETTCLPDPFVRGPADLDRITFSEGHRWFRYLQRGYAHLKGRQDGTFLLSFSGMTGPMDMANAARGNDFFMDVLTEPDFVHRLMRCMTDASRWFHPRLLAWCDRVDGGYIYQFGGFWLPTSRPGHLTNDPAMMCSADVYDEFAFPYEKELAEYYDGSLYHVHNENMQYVPSVVRLPGLRVLQLSNDPKTTPVIEDLPRIYAMTGDLPLMMHATSAQVYRHIDLLKECNVCLRILCRDRQDADEAVRFVRAHSKPL